MLVTVRSFCLSANSLNLIRRALYFVAPKTAPIAEQAGIGQTKIKADSIQRGESVPLLQHIPSIAVPFLGAVAWLQILLLGLISFMSSINNSNSTRRKIVVNSLFVHLNFVIEHAEHEKTRLNMS